MKDKDHQLYYRDLLITVLAVGISYWFFRFDWILIAGAVFVLLGLASNSFRKYNHLIWKGITQILQWTLQPILGGAIFFLIMTPIGLLFQLFRKEKEPQGSNFKEVTHSFDPDFFRKQW